MWLVPDFQFPRIPLRMWLLALRSNSSMRSPTRPESTTSKNRSIWTQRRNIEALFDIFRCKMRFNRILPIGG
jgi:hypothetical protein